MRAQSRTFTRTGSSSLQLFIIMFPLYPIVGMNLEGFIGILATLPTVVNVLGIADIDKKGRMTVPVDVRKDLDIVGLTKVAFVKTREGDVIIKKAEKV